MARINLGKGIRFLKKEQMCVITNVWFTEEYDAVLDEKIPKIMYDLENLSLGQKEVMSYDEISVAWGSGEIRFELLGRGVKDDKLRPLNTEFANVDLETVPKEKRKSVNEKWNLIEDLYRELGIKSIEWVGRKEIEDYYARRIANDNAKKNGLPKRSARSIQRYLKDFILGGGDIRALESNSHLQGDPGVTRSDPIIYEKIDEIANRYKTIRHYGKSFNKFYTELINVIGQVNKARKADGEKPVKAPDKSTVRRRLIKIGWEAVFGQQPSKAKEKADGESHPREATTRVFENIQIDGTLLPYFVVDEVDGMVVGRPYLTAGICTTTELVPGWHVDFNIVKAGYLNVMLMLRHLILPKPDYRKEYDVEEAFPVWGVPEMITTDQGTEFNNKYLQHALQKLGILHDPNPAGQPWLNGKIERYFRTIAQSLLEGEPGYIGNNDRNWAFYDPQETAVVTMSTFKKILYQYLIDIYPHTSHSRLNLRPMTVFKQLRGTIPPSFNHSAAEIRMFLLPFIEGTLQAQGAVFDTIWYSSPALARLRKYWGRTPLQLKQDPDDLDALYVPDPQGIDGYTKFTSTVPSYTQGLTLAKHRFLRDIILREKHADEIDIFELERRKGKIITLVQQDFHLTKSLRKRSKLKGLMDEVRREQQEVSRSTQAEENLTLPISKPEDFYDMGSDVESWGGSYDLPIDE